MFKTRLKKKADVKSSKKQQQQKNNILKEKQPEALAGCS